MEKEDNLTISVELVRDIFKEMFLQQQKDILKIISSNRAILNDRLDKMKNELEEIKETCTCLKDENKELKSKVTTNEERIKKLEDVKKDLEESVTVTQDIQEKKIKELEKRVKHSNHKEEKDRKKLRELEEEDREKFRQLEDRQRRNNLRISGLQENDGESWDDTEKKVLDLFENKLGVKNVVIERAHRIGKKNEEKAEQNTYDQEDVQKPPARTIVLKLLNYKAKTELLKNTNKLAGTGIYINEDFSYETRMIRKKLFGEMKTHRAEGRYAVVLYDKLIVREFRDRIANA
ncbi:myb-like protein X [Hydractinia symbiolongicarpus]|uniref:myb-like protein X n=1 Tax=Hydractinia symbiolongicarpus TaxID=13093 RepID=UPI00254A24D6|nr:myb-like protein X [Hydractinia symbiolongicarpus]